MKRASIVSTDQETEQLSRLVTVDQEGVKAAEDIKPFTCVAVCVGRLFSAKEHGALFKGPIGDPWEQWTFVRNGHAAQQGYVVTPGLPGGALDPHFAQRGASPFFRETPRPDLEPECVYVLNYRKGRLEYWVGRRGARKGQNLRLCYRFEKSTFPVVYIVHGQQMHPVSVNELTRSAYGLRVLERCGGWNNKQHRNLLLHWAKTYDPTKEVANDSILNRIRPGDIKPNTWDRVWNSGWAAQRNRVRANRYWSLPPGRRQVSLHAAPLVARRVADRMESAFLARGVHRVCARLRSGTYNPTTVTRLQGGHKFNIPELRRDAELFAKHFSPHRVRHEGASLVGPDNHRWYPLHLLNLVWDVSEHGMSPNLKGAWNADLIEGLTQFYRNDPTVSRFLRTFKKGTAPNTSEAARIAMRGICDRCCK